ncbi:MAG: hypothetical protein PHR61_03250 [Candidatus Absconditabacteria bacterium]|nr:hypothetical protein [Candidatus Absconditabacteria bacterium]
MNNASDQDYLQPQVNLTEKQQKALKTITQKEFEIKEKQKEISNIQNEINQILLENDLHQIDISYSKQDELFNNFKVK